MTRRDAFLDRLISIISHDLRTPLAVIVGYAELLRLRDDEETRREAPVRIEEAAKRLSRMIDDLLSTAALDAGDIVSDPGPIELGDAIGEAIRRAESCGERRPFSVESDAETVVEADPNHLQQMLVNVFVAAGATASQAAPVAIEAAEEDGVAVVSVSGGPAPDEGQHGASLAVAVARRLAELGGGSLSIVEEPEAATFKLAVPLADRGRRA